MVIQRNGSLESGLSNLKRLLEDSWLVADNTNTPRGEVAQQLWQRISVDLQRAGHRAFARRVGGRGFGARTQAAGMLATIEGLELPGEV